MSGTVAGGLKARDTNKRKDPDFYKKIGAIGGKNGTGHEFAHGKVDQRVAGSKGGKISRRTKKENNNG